MLEVIHLYKTYKSKKSTDTEALSDISLKLGDSGLVFVLGKSGSGKSTFLNVLGGLDSFDKGEIIINGRSSNEFKASDFDSYRNTFLGFVFQDFNILEGFSVGKNIALAM
ncbi:MAG: ATP-binding cassette domain-containing protein, partial [Clostridia bacterium]